MASAREVLTLQIGHYSNFIGTHWWNIQESSFIYDPLLACGEKEINHDVLFREGLSRTGDVTYTPRLVAFDLKDSLNTLKQDGVLYDTADQEEDLNWCSDVTLHKADAIPKNEFLQDLEKQEELYQTGHASTDEDKDRQEREASSSQEGESEMEVEVFGKKLYNLDNSVKVWSDFLRLHLHPKTICLLPQYQHNNELMNFDIHGYGQEVLNTSQFADEVEDHLHFFLEECDHLQGFQIMVDSADGFGGLAAGLLCHLEEDYATKAKLSFGVSPESFSSMSHHSNVFRVINSVLTYEKMCEKSNLFVPLSVCGSLWRKPRLPVNMPLLNYKANLDYHSSAVLAASMDTMSLPYRLHSNPAYLSYMTDSLGAMGRKMGALHSSLPFALPPGGSLVSSINELGQQLPWRPLSPGCNLDIQPFSQCVVSRGISDNAVKISEAESLSRELRGVTKVDEMLLAYCRKRYQYTESSTFSVKQACKVVAPFPHIFSPVVTTDGCLGAKPRLDTIGVESVPVLTSLQSTPSSGALIRKLLDEAARIDLKKYHKFHDCGLEEDDYNETLENLETLASCYRDSQIEDC